MELKVLTKYFLIDQTTDHMSYPFFVGLFGSDCEVETELHRLLRLICEFVYEVGVVCQLND